jgi:hypothetical protein
MSDGSEIWFKDKKIHREDGPAVVRKRDNRASYYLDGIPCSFEQWFKKVGKKHLKPKELTFFLLKYNTNVG